jgi:hypothetical protein
MRQPDPEVDETHNIRHLEEDHPERGSSRVEVDEVMDDPDRVEAIEDRRNVTYHTTIGRTAKGRLLVVIWVDHQRGRFPVHARQAARRAARRYYR